MARRKKGHVINGWINLHKPAGVTSTQAVSIVKRALRPKKIGHGGTLDPLAEGVLPLALGEATKTIPYCQDSDKCYRFTVTWGQSRTTDDEEGEVLETSDVRPAEEQINSIIAKFIGEIEQVPPRYSAIKIDGKRAYDLARQGEEIEIKSRIINVHDLKLIKASEDSADFVCDCGKGTYIRSLGRDIAEELGTKGYISHLERTKVGAMQLESAFSLAKFEEISDSAPSDKELGDAQRALLDEVLLSPATMLDDIPALAINDREAVKLKNGQSLLFVAKPDLQRLEKAGIQIKQTHTALTTCNDKPVALVNVDGPEIKPLRVLNL